MKGKVPEQLVLDRMREICLALPETVEKITYGHPAFANRKGIYAVLEEYGGELSICVKVGPEIQGVFLKDPRFYRTPYIGSKGWVSLKVHAAPLNWDEIGELLAGSYQLMGSKAAIARRSTPPRSRAKTTSDRSKRPAK